MSKKRSARVDYYQRIRQAAVEEFAATEERMRQLEGFSEKEINKLIASVHKRHEKLVKRIDRHIEDETNN